jgi:prolipoprotein diacylglyceryltransferase
LLPADKVDHPGAYAIAAGCGGLVGAMFFGTLNTWLSGVHAIGFSMAGGIAGAIASVELFKRLTCITGPTGIAFAAPFCATVAVGRLGCFFAGLDDFTYGTPTGLAWGVDFGDGVRRHPVQLYEALAMGTMLVVLLWRLKKRDPFWLAHGFYVVVGWYACSALLEISSPMQPAGPFNVFHMVARASFYTLQRGQEPSRP